MNAVSIDDYREMARRRLPHFLFEYIDGGSYAEVTLRRNISDLEKVSLHQRVLRDVSEIDTSVFLFGRKMAMPVVLGPIGLAGMNARRGEIQAAKAAAAFDIPFCLSTLSVCSLGEVASANVPAPWLQLYMIRDRVFMIDLLAQAVSLRCPVLVFTVDMPMPGSRYRDYRSRLAGAPGISGRVSRFCQALAKPYWAYDVGLRGQPLILGNVAPVLGRNSGLEDFLSWMGKNFDPRVTWRDLEWIREHWKGRIVLKGVLHPDDARDAVRMGIDGVIVSNHGGRQLDGVLSTACAIPAIADAVGNDLIILADGGVRSGLDVVRMLALGATTVLLGRAWAYALAARGGAGVTHVLELIAAELKVAMALTGSTSVPYINRESIQSAPTTLR